MSLSIHSNNHCHVVDDNRKFFESSSQHIRCHWLRLHPDHRASLWRSVPLSFGVIIISDDCFSDLCHYKCLWTELCTLDFFQRDVMVFHKHQDCVIQRQPIFNSDISVGGGGGAQQTTDLPEAQTQWSIRLTHIGVLQVIFKKSSIVSRKRKKLFYSLHFEHRGKHWMV